ncbi:ExeM/NucH family extracellular endonuclease [Cyanobium gracile]|uniref:ExeM/NucH family extracellular endonuclease n=1 Tax=Cyanobium gracile UHCC 0281 TaxID=3110309 RepID=A0ABU5SVT4_9CYAN|nr:ExeM/NucH family extracellular endonuclease [Cyanobium gracile]MEA5442609.1 ExeM/NucH family extracellular endonuclease [Cyanobium gracile UHCC 0281]
MPIDLTGDYVQDFDSLPNLPTSPAQNWQDDVTLVGWFSSRTGTGTTIVPGTGSLNAGGLYSFGASGSADRALGSVGSGNAAGGDFTWGVSFRNESGSTIETLYIQYQGEQWRFSGSATAQTLDFQYQTSIQPGLWSDADSLDFTSPIISGSAGALDGNASTNRTLISGTLTNLGLHPGESLQIRWSDPDHPGSDHGLAIDDFQVSVNPLTGSPPAGLTLLQSHGNTVVAEGGGGDSFAIQLDRQPSDAVTLTLAEAAGIPQLVLQPTQLVFTSSNWSVPQTVTLAAIDDDIVEGSQATSLQFTLASADPSYDGLTVPPLPVDIIDNDGVVTRIHAIQGSGASFDPAFAGVQTIEGVVVASFPGSIGLNGFFVQEEDADADADPFTSEGIFVFDPSGRFSGGVGSKVRVTGDVREFTSSGSGIAGPYASSLTQIYDPSTILDLGTVALPAPVSIVLPVADVTVLERYEGMLVTVSPFSGDLIVTDTFKLGRFGQVGLSAGERLDQFTQVNAPSVSGYATYLNELLTRSIILDDGSSRQNPDPVIHSRGGQPLSADNTLRGGDAIGSISGVLDERFEGYRVQTLSPASFTPTNPRSLAPPPVVGEVKVGTFNVLNYFSDLDTNAVISIPGGVSFEPRGANTAIELSRQQEKLVSAILGLDTDVLGLIEIENDGPATLANLVDALNAQAGAGTYAFIDDTALLDDPNPAPNAVGTDAIKVAILYKPGAVLPIGSARSFAEADPANPIFDRPPVAQTFVTPAGGRFSVVVNHFKSKGSSAGLSGDADQGDGQGFSNATRVAQSQALLAFVETLKTSSGDDDVLVLGDLNAYAREDPITTLTNGGLVNLFDEDSYSYQFNGQWGSLDHALATASLSSQVSGAHKWSINADEPVVLDYNTEFKSPNQVNSYFTTGPFRTSDHDPLLIGLTLTNTDTNPMITSGSAFSIDEANSNGITGPSSSATPYITSSNPEVQFTSLFTVGDDVNGYRMVGIPDGMGAFDNGDGTFTLLMNHELANTRGIARAHGQPGAFVSRWVIDKSSLEVLSIEDFLRNGTSVYLSDNDPAAGLAHSAYLAAATTILSRLCSADLAAVSAYQWIDPATGTSYGTAARLFLSGEESSGSVIGVGPEATTLFGRLFAWAATDDTGTPLDEAGTAWEVPHGGLFAWENAVANPLAQRKTLVMGLDDSNGGQMYLWVGDKQTSGTVVERAGLTRQGPDDSLYVVKVSALSSLDGAGVPTETLDASVEGSFTLANLGDVSALSLDGLEAASDAAGATQFLRPEDGQWDPANPSDFYFVTTSRYDQTKDGIGSQVGRSRLYRLRFDDISQPQLGGSITALLDGTEAGNMFDNMTIAGGKVILQEDVGNQQHLGKIWSYDIAADSLTELGSHDRQRFGDVGVPAVAPFNQDEESSGVIDMSEILGAGTFLLNVQAHYAIPGELAEGGQLLLMRTNAASGQPLVTTVTANDPENDPLSFTISGGEDAADFTIDPSTGELRFKVAPDAENPADADGNNVYLVEVSVSDGNSAPVSQTITVSVNPVNEGPTNTTAAAVSVVENTTFVTTASGTDPEGAALSFAISGGADAAHFSIDPATGELRFLIAPDFEAPSDNGANNSYVVGITVSDGVNAPVARSVVVSVTDVKEAPIPSNALSVTPIGSYASGIAGVAEVVAHDPISQQLFSLNGVANRLDVISITNPAAPALVGSIDLAPYGAAPNSVAVKNGLIAVAMQASPKTDAGKVVFFSTAGVFQNQVSVGAQPDMLTFTPDGLKVLVANEGEPNVGDTINPEGSVSIISLAAGVAAATVKTAGFSAFNGQEDKLRGQGVRISAGKSVAVDVEPEYIAVSPDGLTARITLQENNAVAVLDLSTDTITAIQALGLKDYSQGLPQVKTFDFNEASLPVLGTTATGQDLKLGGFSGLHFEGIDAASGNLKFITNTDRGPNGEPSDVLPAVPGNERPFALPDFAPELVRFQLNQATGAISITGRIALKRADGTPLTGLPNLQVGAAGGAYTDEVGVDLAGNQLANDPFGADLEGIVVAPDGSFWLPDEYRPAIYHFDAGGTLIDRLIPIGTAAAAGQPPGSFGTEVLPAVYGQFRRANRGFEAIAMEGDTLYVFIQTNLENPGSGSLNAARANGVIRIVAFDTTTSTVSGEYVYVMRDTTAGGLAKTDKIGDAVALGDGRFLVAERDDRIGTDSNKLIYEINLKGATNVLGTALATATSGTTLESLSPAGLAANGVRPVDKRLVVNAAAIGYTGVSKLEGLAVVDGDTIAVINDNDFQMAGAITGDGSAPLNPNPEPIRLGLIDFNLSNGLDASDRDVDGSSGAGGKINIQPRPVFGMYMPDAIAAYAVGGKRYFITANEGDDRDDFITAAETIRAGASGYLLDPAAFPDAAALKNNAVLGRLTVSAIDGDIDGDGDVDRIQAYGARSFSIWDEAGNRVFDSGDALELITAAQVPALFNGEGTAASFDTRSDNKGPEPEGVAIGEINGRHYAFVGLERVGGFITYDVTDPLKPVFVTYTNPAANPVGTPGQSDRAPEGIAFISAADSPTGQPLVVTGNEVSGSTTLYSVTIPATYTLQILSYYGESGLLGVETAPILGALIDRFDDQYANTLKLGEGDTFIPGPWLIGGADPSLSAVPGIGSTALGRPDIAIFNAFGTDASALGNHEFDLGSPVLQGAISPSGAWGGALFPFITANLNFAADSSLRGLADASIGGSAANAFAGAEASSIKGKIAPYAVVTEGGEKIGIVGSTTFELLSKSSPNGTVPKDDADPATSDLQEVAIYVQAAIDALRAQGINKIVMVDQLDTLDRNKALAPLLSGVDVMVAGGGHERLGDANDVAVAFNGHDADFIPGESFPIVTAGADGKPVLIITTDTEFTYLGRLVIDFDANGEIIVSNLNAVINGAYAATEATLQAAYGTTDSAETIIAASSIGSQVKAITEAINDVIVSKDGNIFGYTSVYLEGDRVFGRTQEVNLGSITADANLAKARAALGGGAVLASLKNGGGIRASIGSIGESGEKLPPASSPVKPAGAISQLDIENALRFDNKLMVFDATPQQLLNILEFAAGLSSGPAQQNGGYAQIGGVRFSYDPSRPAGSKVLDVAVYDEAGQLVAKIADNGVLLSAAPATISVVALNFTANGGDSYPIKANGENFRYLLSDGSLSEAVDESLDFTATATFASVGLTNADLLGEQKAFQDFLLANHATPATAYATGDTPASLDQRIQNLQFKADTVFPGIDLSTYVRVGRYDLPEPTRTTPPAGSLLAQEVSAVTFNQDTGTLFVVGDGGTSVVQVSRTGQLIDSMTLAPGSSPQGTDFYDPEGLTYVGNGQFVLVEERDRQAILFTYAAGGTLTRADTKTVKLGTSIGNVGLEGLTYDPQTGGFIFVKEIQPQGIFQTSIDFDAGTASNGSPGTVNATNLFDPSLAGLADFADVFALSNLDYLQGQSDSANLLVLSQESGKVVEVDRAGNVLSFLTILSDPGNPLSVANQQHEGLTMDDSGYLYIVSENGGGDFDRPQLWVYAPSSVANQAPTAIALTNTVTEIEENTSTTTRLKVADVVISDDGQGANNLTVTGADAAFFEVEASGLYIKAGTVLDFETKTSYAISVAVDDPAVGANPDASTSFNLALTDVVNEGGPPPSTNGLVITEVAPWSSGNSPVAADWFELTNTGSTAIDISGWRMDDNSGSFVASVPLSGISSIAAGESVIFIEGASPNATFLSNWFGANAPAGLQIGSYSGSGVGLSTGGDAVNIYDPNGVLKASVAFGASPAPPTLASFDNAALLNNSLTTLTTLSSVGVNGAFGITSNDGNTEIGSPGRIASLPEPPSLIISEVSPWSSGNSSYGADWFEITNIGSRAVDITGWRFDDNSNNAANAVALNGITSIGAGQSVVFIEGDAATAEAFKTAWFGSNVPADFAIGTYSGSGVGLSTGGDAVNLFDASGHRITGVSFGASTTGFSFDNGAGAGSSTLPLPILDTLSKAGLKGAFLAADGAGTGSPGSAKANAALSLGNELIQNPSAFDFSFGSTLPAAVALQARFLDVQGQPVAGVQTLATAVGQASGLPAGFAAADQQGVLGDGQFDGSVEFFLTNLSSGATTPLSLSGSAATGFVLAGGGLSITASLTPEAQKPEVFNTSFSIGTDALIGLDLSGLTNQLNLDVEIYREAAFNSTLGLYLSDRSTGDVIDPLTGAVASGGSWAGSESAYRQAAVANALWSGTTANNTVASLSATVSLNDALRFSDYVLLPFIQVANTKQIYVAGASRNADDFGHIQLIGTNTFGFEDLRGGGDADFDDLILRVNAL